MSICRDFDGEGRGLEPATSGVTGVARRFSQLHLGAEIV